MLIQNIICILLTMVCPKFDYVKAIYLLFNLIGVLIYGIFWLVIGAILLIELEDVETEIVASILLTAYGCFLIAASVVGFVALSKKIKYALSSGTVSYGPLGTPG
nr:hypothetical transcript [Hymenolepis microstoma]